MELFQPLRRDLTKLSLGTYFAQVSEVISQEDLPNPELLALLLNSLYGLCALDLPESQIKAAFELRAACLAGYAPDLCGCHVCGAEFPDRFDLSAGQLECSRCGESYLEEIQSLGHKMKQESRIEAQCETAGIIIYKCENCDYSQEETIEAHGHEMKELSRVEPTNDDDGVIIYYCSRKRK